MRYLLFLFGVLASLLAHTSTLLNINIREAPTKTSIFFTFNQTPPLRLMSLTTPHRAVIDLSKTNSSINFSHIRLPQGLIMRLRSGHPNADTLRLVFDLTQSVKLTTSPWKPPATGMQGLEITLNKSITAPLISTTSKMSISSPIPVVQLSKTHPLKIAVKRDIPVGLRDVIVVIDPGHGGKDPGAIGSRKNHEKNITLAIAQRLKQLINRQPGMRAVLTRSGDYYVGLRERLNIARKTNADIFISIHADAFVNQHSHGASVYALSPTGATSEAARWLAEKENNSELGGVDLSSLDDQSGVIRSVLLDLSQTATINASLQMGDGVLKHLDRFTTLHHNAVEQARFVVLKSPDIPSILVETGFISNPQEEWNLISPAYQIRLTEAIYQGLNRYFWIYPPHGTRLEQWVNRKSWPRHG